MDSDAKDTGLRRARSLLKQLLRTPRATVAAARSRANPLVREGRDAALEQARNVAERARALYKPEEPERVVREAALFHPFPDTALAPELQSIAWRSDALLGLSAFGVISLEDEITGVTRDLFHDNLHHQDLSRRILGADFDLVHGYMDTVPGTSYRGGGILHRLQHGHDLDAARHIYDDHGLPGVLAWMQHMAQDAMTPTGVPIPAGRGLAEWLVEHDLATPGNAALIVSFNVAEMAAAVLAGAFMLRLSRLLMELQKRRRIRRRLRGAQDAWVAGDFDGAIAHYREAVSLAGGNQPGIELALGWAHAAAKGPTPESFLAFRAAAEGLATTDHAIEMGGLAISLRGSAYVLALSQAIQMLKLNDLRGAWRGELTRMARSAIASFEAVAIAQDESHRIEIGGRRLQLRPRPLSAAANYYLAGRLVAGVDFLPLSGELERLGERAVWLLDRAVEAYPDVPVIEEVRERWAAELAPLRIRVEA